eukprot:SAG11_NODE_24769_length_368_cov_0.955390_2_plen_61_part_01
MNWSKEQGGRDDDALRKAIGGASSGGGGADLNCSNALFRLGSEPVVKGRITIDDKPTHVTI